MNTFVTVREGVFETEINRSRFIGIAARVSCEAQAAAYLDELRRTYRDATHVCYAYVTGEGTRSNDDGEPSGTAGMPIMDCIRSAALHETLVAVVRYFGGIKLGTGGLVRAYTQAAAGALAAAPRVEVAQCACIRVTLPYAVWKKIQKREIKSLYKWAQIEYNSATVDLVGAASDGEVFCRELLALTQGKCTLTPCGVSVVERPVPPA